MKSLLLKSSLLVLALYLTVALGAYLCRRELDTNNYLSVIVDKHKRLESLPSPRLIFIGDSALPFGLDGERIEKELKIPVVNMGLHAAFGLPFIFEEIYPDLRPGDIVAAIFHYYPSDKEINEGVVCHALDFYPAMYRRLELNYFSKKKLEATCDIKRIRRYLLNRIFRAQTKHEKTKKRKKKMWWILLKKKLGGKKRGEKKKKKKNFFFSAGCFSPERFNSVNSAE